MKSIEKDLLNSNNRVLILSDNLKINCINAESFSIILKYIKDLRSSWHETLTENIEDDPEIIQFERDFESDPHNPR